MVGQKFTCVSISMALVSLIVDNSLTNRTGIVDRRYGAAKGHLCKWLKKQRQKGTEGY